MFLRVTEIPTIARVEGKNTNNTNEKAGGERETVAI